MRSLAMSRPDTLIANLYSQALSSKAARKVVVGKREDWEQQVYLELLGLWERYISDGLDAEDADGFREYARQRLPRRMRSWWKGENSWAGVSLLPDYDPDVFDEDTGIQPRGLTDLEQEVWELLSQGYKPQEIAVKIAKSYDMVRQILSDIYKKQRKHHERGDY
jgi:DNA-binding NarL/FixJ family response regulator